MDSVFHSIESPPQRWLREPARRRAVRWKCPPAASRAMLLGMSTLAALLAGEAGLRLCGFNPVFVNPLGSFHEFDPVIGHRGKANFVGDFKRPEFNVRIAHDANGFRNGTVPDRDSSRPVVYVLGDSFTWGWGVEQPFPSCAEPQCAGRRVYNLGVCATGTVQQYAIFQRAVEQDLSPGDVVVLAVYGNDFKDNLGLLSDGALHVVVEDGTVREVAPSSARARSPLWSSVRACSCLVNLIGFVIDEQQLLRKQRRAYAGWRRRWSSPSPLPAPDFSETAAEFVAFRTYLEKFRAACAARGTPFVVMYIPGRSEFHESGIEGEDVPIQEQSACRRAVQRICDSLQVPLCDVTGVFLEVKNRDPNYRLTFEHDFHWNAAGHRIAGAALAEFLSQRCDAPAEPGSSAAPAAAGQATFDRLD